MIPCFASLSVALVAIINTTEIFFSSTINWAQNNFQFKPRLLSEADNVFEFNTWDRVENDDAYMEYAEQQYTKQREAPVSDFDNSTLSNIFLTLPHRGSATAL